MELETKLKKFNVFEAKGMEVKTKADNIIIKTPEDLQPANWVFKECQTLEKETEAVRVWLVKPLRDEVTEINNFVKNILMPVDEAKLVVKKKILDYNEEQEKIRAEEAEIERKRLETIRLKEEQERKQREDEERKIREAEEAKLEAIRKKQEEDRKKIEEEQNENKKKEMEIENKRLEEEAKIEAEKMEIERKNREMETEKKRLEEEKADMERQKVLDKERKKKEQLEATYKVKGVRSRMTFEVIDEEKIPRNYCSSDSKKINEAIKKGIRQIDGVTIFNQKNLA